MNSVWDKPSPIDPQSCLPPPRLRIQLRNFIQEQVLQPRLKSNLPLIATTKSILNNTRNFTQGQSPCNPSCTRRICKIWGEKGVVSSISGGRVGFDKGEPQHRSTTPIGLRSMNWLWKKKILWPRIACFVYQFSGSTDIEGRKRSNS